MSDPILGPVFVTGGARGVGSAVARRLAGEGAHVGVADVDRSAAFAVATENPTCARSRDAARMRRHRC